jgi:hypothetical protein
MESVQTKGDRILPERQKNHNENIKFQVLYFRRKTSEMEEMGSIKPMGVKQGKRDQNRIQCGVLT